MAESKNKTARPAQVIKRDGSVVPFDETKIADAVYAGAAIPAPPLETK